MKLVSFSNKRPAATEQGTVVTVSPTTGKLRMTPKVATLLEITEGEYVGVAGDEESGAKYIHKGMKDEKTQVGNKLSAAGNSFEFGSKNVWDELGGSVTKSTQFTVSETPVEFDGVKYYELTDPQVKEKTERKKDEDKAINGSEDTVGAKEAPIENDVAEDNKEEEEEGFSLE